MSPTETRTTWQSIRTLFSPQTIPFLRSQGVVPKLFPVVTLLLGMVLAFIWGYGISPTVNIASEPVNLGTSWKEEWMKQAAWQFAASGDAANTKTQLDSLGNAKEILDGLLAKTSDTTLQPKLQALRDQNLAVDAPDIQKKTTPGLLNGNFTPVLCVVFLGLLLGLAVVVNTIIPITLILKPRARGTSTAIKGTNEAERRKKQNDAIAAAKTSTPAPVAAPGAPPVVDRGQPTGKFISTYVLGDDLYDDSFAIETASNEFLGETGTGISKTVGVGDPKKVTAVEAWVFDKNDIRTLTKVLMSEWAYNDEATRAELAPKGEAVKIDPGSVVLLETQTLTIQVRVLTLTYGTGALPPNSFFEQLSVEISAWPKKADGNGAGAGAGAPPPNLPDAFGETGPVKAN